MEIGLLLAVMGFPWACAAIAALAQARLHTWLLSDGQPLAESAGDWLRAFATRRRLPVTIEVHDEGSDGYFPSVDAIGLSWRTAASRHPVHRAIAAHELGHAVNARQLGDRAEALIWVRGGQVLLSRGFVAALAVGVLMDAAWLVTLAGVLAVLLVIAATAVVVDEAMASERAWRWVKGHLGPDAWRARWSLNGALAVYGSAWLGRIAVVAAWPLVQGWALSGEAPAMASSPNVAALWLLLFLVPAFAMHGVYVVAQVWRPEPVQSGFRLLAAVQKNGSWAFLTGFGTLLLIWGLHDHLSGSWHTALLALAALTAVQPAASLAQMILVLPVLLVFALFGRSERDRPEWLSGTVVRDDEGPSSLMRMYSDPPAFLRLSWALDLAYVPLIAAWCVVFLAGGGPL